MLRRHESHRHGHAVIAAATRRRHTLAFLLGAFAMPADAFATSSGSVHHDAAGFTLLKPAGWRVQSGSAADIGVSAPHGNAAALVRARSVPSRTALAQWLQQHYAATEP